MPSDGTVTVSRRDRLLIAACVALITLLAWAYLLYLARAMGSSTADNMMAAMGMPMHASWTLADAFFTFAMWTVMMIGMMAGSAAPMLFLFAGARAGRQERSVPWAVALFGLGYLLVWIGFSAMAAFAQWALHQAAIPASRMLDLNPRLAGLILIGAGAYQLTPFKGACLTHCRSPLGFLMTNWRDGTAGALAMGFRHGVYCLGCCWALMCVLFAVGVMNLAWVAALTVFVLLEKVGPAGSLVSRAGGGLMIVAGALLLLGPFGG